MTTTFNRAKADRDAATARIAIRNVSNHMTNLISKELEELFLEYCALDEAKRKICKTSGYKGFTKAVETKVDRLVDKFMDSHPVFAVNNNSVRVYTTYGCIICKVRIRDSYNKRDVTNELYFARFNEDTGCITTVNDPTSYRTDYNVEEYIDARNQEAYHQDELLKAQSLIKQMGNSY